MYAYLKVKVNNFIDSQFEWPHLYNEEIINPRFWITYFFVNLSRCNKPKPMNKNYPIYNTTFIDDMRSLVEEAAQNFPDSIAISYKDSPNDKEVRKVTFTQWREDVRNLGTALINNNLREENIAIVGENSYGWCCSFFAVMAIGSVTVPVDKELPIQDIDGIITTTGCKAIIFGKTAEEKIKELLKNGGLKSAELLVSIQPESSIDKELLAGKTLISVAELEAKGGELYKSGDNSYYDYKIDVNKLASIVFTSGTTGKGKGVMLSQANICLENQGESADIYYNLGNSYYKMDNIAKAILNYERALLLNPGDSDIRFNLELAQSKTVDKVIPMSEIFFITWIKSLTNSMSEKGWAKIGIITFILILASLSLYFFGKKIILKKIGFITAIVSLFLCILANSFASTQKEKASNQNNAIIMAPSVTVKSTPNENGTELFILHEGRKVIIKDNTMKDWKEIQLEDGNAGWVSASDLEVI